MPGARPRKIGKDVIDKICQAREIGATYEIAALYAGLSHATLSVWLKDARALRDELAQSPRHLEPHEKLLQELITRIDAADGTAAISWLQVVDSAASTDPAWAMRMLATRYKEFIQKQQDAVAHEGKIEIVVTYANDQFDTPKNA